MSDYDVVDQVVIDAEPEVVWQAILAEFRGARRWWVPHNTFCPGAVPSDRVGGEVTVTVHTRGVAQRGLRLRFTARTREVAPARRLVADYVAGAFRGSSDYSLDPLDGGTRTRLSLHWQARPQGWVGVLAHAVDIGQEHSRATIQAFDNLGALIGGRTARRSPELATITAVGIKEPC